MSLARTYKHRANLVVDMAHQGGVTNTEPHSTSSTSSFPAAGEPRALLHLLEEAPIGGYHTCQEHLVHIGVQTLNSEEMAERRQVNLCFNCDEPFTRSYKCKHLFCIEVINDAINDDSRVDASLMVLSFDHEDGLSGDRTMRLLGRAHPHQHWRHT